MALKNVVFDFGGVMVGYDPEGYLKRLYGDGPAGEYILRTLFDSALVRRLDLGVSTREREYGPVMRQAEADGFGEEMRYVAGRWVGDVMGTKEDTVKLVSDLRSAGYGVYYLTNMPEDLWVEFVGRGLRDIFMGGVASFEVHVTKPDERIYRILFERCGLEPGECVFLDDMPGNIEGGRALGMDGILFTNAEAVRAELAGRGFKI